MVTIKYYSDPFSLDPVIEEHASIMDYITTSIRTKDELLDLRFFYNEILGEEIDQSDLSFLEINKGVVAITHDSAIPTADWVIYIVVAVVAAFAAVALAPSVPKQVGSRSQQSATNRLGSSINEPRINQRIDDIFGTVTKHTPSLWQVPYRIGVNNQETEVLLLCVGRGSYLISEDEIYDGDTPLLNIDNAQFSKYEPSTYPGNGTPSLQIGEDINEEIGIYRQSNDLNPAELLPSNESLSYSLGWELTGSGTDGILTITSIPTGLDLTNFFSINDVITLGGLNYFNSTGTITLSRQDETIPDAVITYDFDTYDRVDLGEDETLLYTINAVTATTITVTIPATASADVVTAWSAMSAYSPLELAYKAVAYDELSEFYTLNSLILDYSWFTGFSGFEVYTTSAEIYTLSFGIGSTGTIGPITIPDNASEIMLNFVSESGFYKLRENIETVVITAIKITIEEIDINGDPTGQTTTQMVTYRSNDNIRNSVFKTVRITLPYTYNTVSASRTGTRDKSEGVSNVDIVKWRDLYSFESVSDLDFGDVTLAHVVIPSNSQSRIIKERKQNMNVTRLITEYLGDGLFGDTESFATDNFAQILTHVSLDPHIGRMTIDNINADGFLLLSDQIINYYGYDFNARKMVRFGYDFDDMSLTYQDTFMLICNAVNCLPYIQNGMFDAFFEGQQDESSAQITCRNKIPNSETREQVFERKHDGVEVSYRNEVTSVTETINLPLDGSALNPDVINLSGCVTEMQAFRYAVRVYNKQTYNRFSVVFEVDEFGRNIIPGKRIDSPDSTRFTLYADEDYGYKVYEGEVVEVTGLNVELSEPVTFTNGEDHYIVFTNENGDNSESILCTSVDDFTVLLNALPTEAIYDGYSRDRTKYTFASEQLRESIALIPQTIEYKSMDNSSGIHTISSMNYSAGYYKDDLETLASYSDPYIPTYNGVSSYGELDTRKYFSLTDEGVNLILSIDFRTAYTGTQALLGGTHSTIGHLTLNSNGHGLQFAISEYHDPVNFELADYADSNWHTLKITRTASTVTAKFDNVPLVGGGDQDETGGIGGIDIIGANKVGGSAMTNFFNGNLRNFKITDAVGYTETFLLTKTDIEYSVENKEPEYGPFTAAEYLQMWETEVDQIDAYEAAANDGSLEITYNGGGDPSSRIGRLTIPVPFDRNNTSTYPDVSLSLVNAKVYTTGVGYWDAPSARGEVIALSNQPSTNYDERPVVQIDVYNNFDLGEGDVIFLINVSVTPQSWTRNFITLTDVGV